MPIYEYECPTHGVIEIQHSMNEKKEFCPECESNNKKQEIKKLISSSNFILQGGCWAKDNYK